MRGSGAFLLVAGGGQRQSFQVVTFWSVPAFARSNFLPHTTMKITPVRGLLLVGALCASVLQSQAQVVTLRATLSGAQEVPAVNSPGKGEAIMFYDLASNTFDLVVALEDLTNTIRDSHIHEAPAGVNGQVKAPLGDEANYQRVGNRINATFRGVKYTGDRNQVLRSGLYYNVHTPQNTGGEIRGQLIPQPVRLVANLDVAQEAASNPTINFSNVNSFGGAVLLFDPVTNKLSIRHSLFNYVNTFTNSHVHEAPPGQNGGTRIDLGTSATAGSYNSTNGHIAGAHENLDVPAAVVMPLVMGGTYLNYHSNVFPGGQLRGQITVSSDLPNTRMANLSARGFVGTGDQVLIGGLVITGTEPVRTLITAKGPSLTALGVSGAVANPRLELRDSAGRVIATNDDIGPAVAGSELSRIQGAPANPQEAALVVVLPPGNYTAIVSAASGTGVALLETYDLRGQTSANVMALRAPAANAPAKMATSSPKAAATVELCATPVPVAVAMRE